MPGGGGGLGTSTQSGQTTQNTQSQSQTGPWSPAVPSLQNYFNPGTGSDAGLSSIGFDQSKVNDISNALATPGSFLYNNANQGVNNLAALNGGFADQLGTTAARLGNQYVNGGNGGGQGDPFGILGGVQNTMTPYAQGDYLDPRKAPFMQQTLQTIQNDVQNSVNSQFAGAGRSLSGLNEQAVARGLSQGEAQPLLNQYNQNVANQFNANNVLQQLSQQRGANQQQGMQYGQMAPALATAVPQAQSDWNVAFRSAPMQLQGAAENLLLPIAGLGGTASGTQNTQSTFQGSNTASPLSQIQQGIGVLGGLGGLI